MRVYVAGPMSSVKFYNWPAFRACAEYLRSKGHEVETPFDANSRVWERHYGRPFNPLSDRCDYGDPVLREMFADDVATLLRCDAIALLEGWHASTLAPVELRIARLFGLAVLTEEGEPFSESVLEEAQRLVHGDRGAAYGHPIDDYTCTGRIWAALLDHWLRTKPGWEDMPTLPDIDPRIAAVMMAGMKLSREAHKHKRDSLTDCAGYAECANMIAERQESA